VVGFDAARARQHAVEVCKWNAALNRLTEQALPGRPRLQSELRELLGKAGLLIYFLLTAQY